MSCRVPSCVTGSVKSPPPPFVTGLPLHPTAPTPRPTPQSESNRNCAITEGGVERETHPRNPRKSRGRGLEGELFRRGNFAGVKIPPLGNPAAPSTQQKGGATRSAAKSSIVARHRGSSVGAPSSHPSRPQGGPTTTPGRMDARPSPQAALGGEGRLAPRHAPRRRPTNASKKFRQFR